MYLFLDCQDYTHNLLQSGIRVKIQFLIGTGTAEGQLNVFKTGAAYQGQAQHIEKRHGVFRTGTAYRGQAQRI